MKRYFVNNGKRYKYFFSIDEANEFLSNNPEWKHGYYCSKSHRDKIRKKKLGVKRKEFSEEWRKNLSKAGLGKHKKKLSEEARLKISEATKGRIPWNKGKTGVYSESTLKRISATLTGRKLTEQHRINIVEGMYKSFTKLQSDDSYSSSTNHSKSEIKIFNYLNNFFRLKRDVVKLDNGKIHQYDISIYLPKGKYEVDIIEIEYDGDYWHSTDNPHWDSYTDKLREKYALRNNRGFIIIKESEFLKRGMPYVKELISRYVPEIINWHKIESDTIKSQLYE